MSAVAPSRRTWSLGFGVAYLVGAALAGFNLDLVWAAFAPDGVRGQAHHLASVLTTVFPHVVAIAGFALLVAGQRMARPVFALVALIPAVFALACLVARASYP